MATGRKVSWSTLVSLDESNASSTDETQKASGRKSPRPSGQKLLPSLKQPSYAVASKISAKDTSNSRPAAAAPAPAPAPLSSMTTEMANVIIAKHSNVLKDSSRSGQETWRKHGKLFRAKLIMNDEESGGNTFVLTNNCSIEKYYDVAERVLEQFLNKFVADRDELNESYLVGTRLVKFLSTVLPTHTDYFATDPVLDEMRAQSQSQLVQLLQYLEQLALIIDECEENNYILNDLTESKAAIGSKGAGSTTSTTTDRDKRSHRIHEETNSILERSTDTTISSVLFAERTLSSETTMNTTIETTLTTATGDLDVVDMDFFNARDSHLLSLQKEESNAWDEMFSQQCGTEPIKETDKSNEFEMAFCSAVEWDPYFPVASIPKKAQDTSSPPSQQQSPGVPPNLSLLKKQGSLIETTVYADPQRETATKKSQVVNFSSKAEIQEPMQRESSPKSIMELSEWGYHDQLEESKYFQFLAAVDGGSITSQEAEDFSLTSMTNRIHHRRRNRKQLEKFKGCIRCLLE